MTGVQTCALPIYPLPIQTLRDANRDAREGRFIPDRDNDELTRALGNAEHSGRVRATEGSLPWSIGFPEDKKRYPDRSHKRRKEKEASEKRIAEEEKRIAADHLRAIEERFRNIEARLPPAARLEESAFDGTDGHQLIVKSSVASTEVAATTGDDAHTMAGGNNGGPYLVDYITDSTPCDLHVTFMGLDMKVAVGIALPIGPKPTYHCRAVPQGYAVVGVDEVLNPTDRKSTRLNSSHRSLSRMPSSA